MPRVILRDEEFCEQEEAEEEEKAEEEELVIAEGVVVEVAVEDDGESEVEVAERGQTPTNSMTSRVSLGSSEMPSLGNWILEEEGNGWQGIRRGG